MLKITAMDGSRAVGQAPPRLSVSNKNSRDL
jgi:hypothetical protein